jgi:hypothetical protein
MSESDKTYLAIVESRSGYVLDAYPEEVEKYKRQLTDTVKGEFPTEDEAVECVMRILREGKGAP